MWWVSGNGGAGTAGCFELDAKRCVMYESLRHQPVQIREHFHILSGWSADHFSYCYCNVWRSYVVWNNIHSLIWYRHLPNILERHWDHFFALETVKTNLLPNHCQLLLSFWWVGLYVIISLQHAKVKVWSQNCTEVRCCGIYSTLKSPDGAWCPQGHPPVSWLK